MVVSSTRIHSSDLRRWARQRELGRLECAQDRLVWFAEFREALGKEREDLLGLTPFVFDEVSQRHDESFCRLQFQRQEVPVVRIEGQLARRPEAGLQVSRDDLLDQES